MFYQLKYVNADIYASHNEHLLKKFYGMIDIFQVSVMSMCLSSNDV